MKLLGVLWLVIFSDGVAAFIAGRGAWGLRDRKDSEQYEFAVGLTIGLFFYSVARFLAMVNSIYVTSGTPPPLENVIRSLGINGLQSLGVWVVALTLLNGRPKGFARRTLSKVLRKL